jgi:drug/metabolite transporter (DMT)-like permease
MSLTAMAPRTKGEILLVLVTVIWGSTFVLTKVVLRDFSPFAYIVVRFLLASVLFGALFFQRLRSLNRAALRRGSILGLLLFIGFSFQTVGLQYTSASKSAFITGRLVVFTPLCQLLIERKRPSTGNFLGVVLVTLGLYLLTSPQGSGFNLGDGLTLVCAFCFAVYIVLLDVYARGNDPVHLTFLQFVSTAILGIAGIAFLEHPRISVTPESAGAVVFLTVMATIVALYIQTKYQSSTTPTRAALIFSLEPVIAAVVAYLALGERIGMLGIAGGSVILAGLLTSEMSDALFQNQEKA